MEFAFRLAAAYLLGTCHSPYRTCRQHEMWRERFPGAVPAPGTNDGVTSPFEYPARSYGCELLAVPHK